MAVASTARKSIGARELKTRLGRYLRAVQRGTTITITERGVPVASLSPVAAQEEGIDAALDDLHARGILSKGTGEPIATFAAVKLPGESIARTISRDRDDRL